MYPKINTVYGWLTGSLVNKTNNKRKSNTQWAFFGLLKAASPVWQKKGVDFAERKFVEKSCIKVGRRRDGLGQSSDLNSLLLFFFKSPILFQPYIIGA